MKRRTKDLFKTNTLRDLFEVELRTKSKFGKIVDELNADQARKQLVGNTTLTYEEILLLFTKEGQWEVSDYRRDITTIRNRFTYVGEFLFDLYYFNITLPKRIKEIGKNYKDKNIRMAKTLPNYVESSSDKLMDVIKKAKDEYTDEIKDQIRDEIRKEEEQKQKENGKHNNTKSRTGTDN